jgi:pyruvate dehydrogenase E1 component alpha subunit
MSARTTDLELYRQLLLIRRAEERIRREYPGDQLKTPVHLGIGAEAIAVGVLHAAPRGVKVFGTYRNHAIYLALTDDLDGFFGELYGRVTGCGRGKAGSMHLTAPDKGLVATSAVVGTTIPVAVGAALAQQLRGDTTPVVVFFGDGAVEEGVFWESLNFACLRKLPVLFVCEDNGLAIHTPVEARQGFRSIVEAVAPFRCEIGEADGSDLEAVIGTTGQVLSRMAAQRTPGFVCFPYFRTLEHVGPAEDFKAGYRPRPTDEQLAALDPVRRCEARLAAHGVPAGDLERIANEIDRRIDASVDRAERAPFPAGDELTEHLWA